MKNDDYTNGDGAVVQEDANFSSNESTSTGIDLAEFVDGAVSDGTKSETGRNEARTREEGLNVASGATFHKKPESPGSGSDCDVDDGDSDAKQLASETINKARHSGQVGSPPLEEVSHGDGGLGGSSDSKDNGNPGDGATQNDPPETDGVHQSVEGLKRASDVQTKPVEWLMPGIPLGKLTVLVGEMGQGKTAIMLALAALVTTGGNLPGGTAVEKGSMLFISAEDDDEDTLIPRFVAAGGDRSRLLLPSSVSDFFLADDNTAGRLDRILTEAGDIRLIVFDPISSFTGRQTGDPNQYMRKVLAPFMPVLSKHRVALVGLTHFNKDTEASRINRISGAGALPQVARSVLDVTTDAQDPQLKIVTPIKANLQRDNSPVLGYRLVGRSVQTDSGDVTTVVNARLVRATKIQSPLEKLVAGCIDQIEQRGQTTAMGGDKYLTPEDLFAAHGGSDTPQPWLLSIALTRDTATKMLKSAGIKRTKQRLGDGSAKPVMCYSLSDMRAVLVRLSSGQR